MAGPLPPPPADLAIDDLLQTLGFVHPSARDRALELLIAHGLTRPGKGRISAQKLPAVREVLGDRLVVTCDDAWCIEQGTKGARRERANRRERLPAVTPAGCMICEGSPNKRQVDAMVDAMAGASMRRLVVVGGSPATRMELERLVAGRLDLRLVDGTARRTGDQARGDVAWGHRVVVWGATELDHKVSKLYTDLQGPPRVVTAPSRGIATLAQAVLRSLRESRPGCLRGRPRPPQRSNR